MKNVTWTIFLLTFFIIVKDSLAVESENANPLLKENFANPSATISKLTPHNNYSQERLRLQAEQNKRSDIILIVSISTIALLTIATLILTILFMIRVTPVSARDIVNAVGLIIIVYGTLFLVLVTENQSQITAAIGVLGAIAGYLFGSFKRTSEMGKDA